MTGAWRILRRAYRGFVDDDGTAIAGYIAFSALLGLFPFLILAANLGALFVGPDEAEALVEALFVYAPPHVAQTIEPVVGDVLAGAEGGLLTISALAALWFSSNAVEAVRTAFERAYDVPSPWGLVSGRFIAFFFVLIGVAVAIILGVTIVFAPLLIQSIESFAGITVPGIVGPARLAVGLLVFTAYLFLLHRVLPRHGIATKGLWPGVLLTTGIWIVAATGFSIYLGYTPTYATTYGALAGVVISLMFFYITGLAVIFGAEVNAALAHFRQEQT